MGSVQRLPRHVNAIAEKSLQFNRFVTIEIVLPLIIYNFSYFSHDQQKKATRTLHAVKLNKWCSLKYFLSRT